MPEYRVALCLYLLGITILKIHFRGHREATIMKSALLFLGLFVASLDARVSIERMRVCSYDAKAAQGRACNFGFDPSTCNAVNSIDLLRYQNDPSSLFLVDEMDNGWFLLRVKPSEICMYYAKQPLNGTILVNRPPFTNLIPNLWTSNFGSYILPMKDGSQSISYQVYVQSKPFDATDVEKQTFEDYLVDFRVEQSSSKRMARDVLLSNNAESRNKQVESTAPVVGISAFLWFS